MSFVSSEEDVHFWGCQQQHKNKNVSYKTLPTKDLDAIRGKESPLIVKDLHQNSSARRHLPCTVSNSSRHIPPYFQSPFYVSHLFISDHHLPGKTGFSRHWKIILLFHHPKGKTDIQLPLNFIPPFLGIHPFKMKKSHPPNKRGDQYLRT